MPARLWHAATRRPIDAHDPATTVVTFRVEPIHDRVDEDPFVPLVLDRTTWSPSLSSSCCSLMLPLLAPTMPRSSSGTSPPKLKSILMKGRPSGSGGRILSICHALKASARSVRDRVPSLSIRQWHGPSMRSSPRPQGRDGGGSDDVLAGRRGRIASVRVGPTRSILPRDKVHAPRQMTPVSVWRRLRVASPGLETIRVVVRTDEARKATGEAGKLHSINAWLAASESRQCLGCLTPSLLHALASVHEPERWLSPLARRPGAPQRTRPAEGAAALYRRSLPMPNFHIRRGGRRIT